MGVAIDSQVRIRQWWNVKSPTFSPACNECRGKQAVTLMTSSTSPDTEHFALHIP